VIATGNNSTSDETRALGSGLLGVAGELPPGTLLDDWRVEAKIGEGGMGTVYAAVHDVIGKRAALKVIRAEACTHPGASARLLQEARVVNQISHKNIIDIFYAGELPDGRPFLVMELLDGKTLGDRLAEGRVAALDAIDILLQICAALAAAHGHHVIHRDLKPDNIVLVRTPNGPVVKLLDWGIAKMNADAADGTRPGGTLVGTPRYIAPEQARGKRVEERTDVYSLGAIAYELFLEQPPFVSDNVADLLAAHLREPVAPPRELWPDVPEELDELLLAMLAKEPEERPPLDVVTAVLARVRVELLRRAGDVEGLGEPVPAIANLAQPASEWSSLTPLLREGAALMDTCDVNDLSFERAPRRRSTALTAACIVVVTLGMLGGFARLFAAQARGITAGAARIAPRVRALGPVAAAPSSELEVRFTPDAAHVLVDGLPLVGEDGRVQRTIPPGRHAIDIFADGFLPYTRTIEVEPGRFLLAVDLPRVQPPPRAAPAPAPVKHVRRRSTAHLHPDATIDPFR